MFAAVFLSTAIFEPGRFNPLGTLVGIYFLETGILGLQLLGLQSWVSQVFYGGILVIAVTISTVLHRRSSLRSKCNPLAGGWASRPAARSRRYGNSTNCNIRVSAVIFANPETL